MAKLKIRGVEARHEPDQQGIIRDTRHLSQRIIDFFKDSRCIASLLVIFAVVSLVLAFFSDILLFLGIICFIAGFLPKQKLPFRMPQRSNRKDYGDMLPGAKPKPRKARGIYYFGNDRRSTEELWFSDEDMRTHVLIFGSTGSGKTEVLISLAYNALVQASGFIYVDGKGDNGLFAKLFSMTRSMGRLDDLLLINFMTGARDIIGPQKSRLSNTMNPFADGSSSMVTQLVVSLMDSGSKSGDGDMWKGRAIAFVEALMKALVAMRDAGYILLDANTIRNYFHLDRIESMVLDKLFVRDNQESINIEAMPAAVLEPINNYLLTLPGYNKDKKGKQVSQVLEQHGFITMQLTRVFTSLADTYGHILRTKLGEVDLKDVVLNRRILAVLLPALEKSPDELSNLGKVVIASLKAMMASGLGDSVEGEVADLIDSKPTNAKTPYLCILDEYGYYAVEGFAVVPAQARSLGFSVVFAGQDLPAFQKASKEEAASIGANTNIKICMKLEDPMETWEFFMKTAGESYVSHVESFQSRADGLSVAYNDSAGARLEKRARIDLLDLKEQGVGEAHIFFKSQIIRARTYFANPKPVKKLCVNQFLKVDVPTAAELEILSGGFDKFNQLLASGFGIGSEVGVDREVGELIESIASQDGVLPIELFLNSPDNQQQTHAAGPQKQEEVVNVKQGHLHVFTPMQMTAYLQPLLLANDVDKFSRALLKRANTRDQIEYLQRLCGKNSQQSMNIAMELIADMQKGTVYPPEIIQKPSGEELGQLIEGLIDKISLKKKENVDDKK